MSSGGKKYNHIFKKIFSGKFPLTEGKITSVYSTFPQTTHQLKTLHH